MSVPEENSSGDPSADALDVVGDRAQVPAQRVAGGAGVPGDHGLQDPRVLGGELGRRALLQPQSSGPPSTRTPSGFSTLRAVPADQVRPIGCLAVAAARHRGAGTVLAADADPGSLVVARAMEADVVVEASGAPSALGAVLRACVRGGTVVQVGNLPRAPAPSVLGAPVTREITWTGSFRFVEMTGALRAPADGIDVSPVVSHRFDLDDAPQAMAVAAAPGSSKVMVRLDR